MIHQEPQIGIGPALPCFNGTVETDGGVAAHERMSLARSMADEGNELKAITCRDIGHLSDRHPLANGLVSPQLLAAYSEFPGASDGFPLFFYVQRRNQLCSYFRVIPDEVTVDGEPRPWAWSGDNYTYPEFRKRGLSTWLQSEATHYLHEMGVARGSVFSTDVTRHIFEKLGFAFVGCARRLLFLRSVAPLLQAHLADGRSRQIAEAILRPLAASAATAMGFWCRALARHAECVPADASSEPELARFLESVAAHRDVHFAMEAGLLRKKLEVASTTGDVSLWLLQDRQSRDCLAYMIVRERFQDRPLAEKYCGFRLMTLMDFGFVHGNSRAASGILGHLSSLFLASKCDVLEIISNSKLLNRTAARRGLVPVGKGMTFTCSVPEEWNWSREMYALDRWPLTNFCGDGFTF